MVIHGFSYFKINLNYSSNSKFKFGFEYKPKSMISIFFGWLFIVFFRIIKIEKEPQTMVLEYGLWF